MKYLAKVVSINPTSRVLTAKTFNGKIFSGVNIIKNGQPIPSIGDLVVIDDALMGSDVPMYICLGTVDFEPYSKSEVSEASFATEDSEISYNSDKLAPLCERDWQHYNPIFNSFIGTSGEITAIVNDIVSILLDSTKSSVDIAGGEINVKTNSYEIKIDDSQSGIPVFRFEGNIEYGVVRNSFLLEIVPNDANKFLRLLISSQQYGDLLSIIIDQTGKLIIENKSDIKILSDKLMAALSDISLDVLSNVNLNANDIMIKASQVVINMVNGLTAVALGKINITSQDSVNIAGGEINIMASGDPITGTLLSKKVIIRSDSGSVLILTPSLDTNPATNSGIFLTSGFSESVVKNIPSLSKGIGIFARDPGGIVIGGFLPSPVGINSFVKFNQFSIFMSALLTALATFASAQASVCSSGPLAPLAPGFTALASAIGAIIPMILTCKSIMVTTAEP
ncbi:MAG: hypothetical protein ABIM30_00240 [candidate division WOR-3 bacterium]